MPCDATAPRERPILFKPRLVKSILDGHKTQTRRVAREPIRVRLPHGVRGDFPIGHDTVAFAGVYEAKLNRYGAACVVAENGRELGVKPNEFEWCCPYGAPGDRLWVRETWKWRNWGPAPERRYRIGYSDGSQREFTPPQSWKPPVAGLGDGWVPNIFLPRWASRLTLEIVSVRVERLQAITEEDARAEGVERDTSPCDHKRASCDEVGCLGPTHRATFADRWDTTNAKRPGCSWADDPWVWVVGFKRVEARAS